jgi:hypothetical protein
MGSKREFTVPIATTCPFCHYTRQPTDEAPVWQCPKCQKVYAKGVNPAHGLKSKESVPSSRNSIYVLLVGIFTGFWFVKCLEPTSVVAFALFSGWLSVPYFMSYYMLKGANDRKRGASAFTVCLILVAEGVVLLTDIVYVHPDAQGGIAVLMVPILQLASLPLLSRLCDWLSKKLSHS